MEAFPTVSVHLEDERSSSSFLSRPRHPTWANDDRPKFFETIFRPCRRPVSLRKRPRFLNRAVLDRRCPRKRDGDSRIQSSAVSNRVPWPRVEIYRRIRSVRPNSPRRTLPAHVLGKRSLLVDSFLFSLRKPIFSSSKPVSAGAVLMCTFSWIETLDLHPKSYYWRRYLMYDWSHCFEKLNGAAGKCFSVPVWQGKR